MIAASREGDIAVIEIDRHERRNALDTAHCEALRERVGQMAGGGARAIVVTGTGSTFSAGADLGAAYDGPFRAAPYAMLTAITDVPVPVLAAVNGPPSARARSWRSPATCVSWRRRYPSRSPPRASVSRSIRGPSAVSPRCPAPAPPRRSWSAATPWTLLARWAAGWPPGGRP
jgi:hypothetical protein